MELVGRILNSRLWLIIMGLMLTAFMLIGLVSGQVVDGAATFWNRELTENELNMAAVIEIVWSAHVLGMGIMILGIGLFAADPVRARVGAVAVLAAMGSQFLAAIWSANFGYAGANGFNAFAVLIMVVPLITLISCFSKLNARR